jgi:hypothetical protein
MGKTCLINTKEDEKGIAGQARNDRPFRIKMNKKRNGFICRIGIILTSIILFAGEVLGNTKTSGIELDGDTPWLISEEQSEAVQRALYDVQADWYQVFGRNPVVLTEIPDTYTGPVIYLGEKGTWRDALIKEPFPGAESFVLRLQQDSKGRPALVVTGADKRGSIYAAYAFSEEILGIDPWYYWTDHAPAVKNSITVAAGFNKSSGTPTFKYRGWFINDEDLLSMFTPDPLRENVFSLEMFDKIYETILRLKGNMVAPATFPFPDERCQELAARRGLVINMHHILVLGLNTFRWPEGIPFSYSKYPVIMERYWQTCIDAFKDYEVVWTVGYRGKHDQPFWVDEPELKTDEERGTVITKAIAKQVEMIRKVHPNADIISNLWMEGANLYQQGFIKLPEGVILVWPDNGAGFICDKPQMSVYNNQTSPDETGRVQKGQGIYYHTAMMNGRANQLTEMVPPERIYHEILRFVKADATMFFLDNLSDIRPVPLSTGCAMKLVWDAKPYLNKTDEENMADFLNDWSQRQFGSKLAAKIATNYNGYFNIPYIKEQASEFMIHSTLRWLIRTAMTFISENKPLDDKTLNSCKENLKFASENRAYVAKLTDKAVSLAAQVPAERKDFYQSHVLTQLQIHLYSLAALEYFSQSALAYHSGNKTEAVRYSEKAIEASKEVFVSNKKGEYGKWANWYRGEYFVGIEHSYDQLRIWNARLKNEPIPFIRKGRNAYRDIDKYQEAFKDNFPLLYPKK